jgi:hypothetical protein
VSRAAASGAVGWLHKADYAAGARHPCRARSVGGRRDPSTPTWALKRLRFTCVWGWYLAAR